MAKKKYSYSTVADLKTEIVRRAGYALNNEVAEHVTNKLRSHVKSDVYDIYTPKMYERREEDDGLLDQGNIRKTYRAGVLNIYEEAPPALPNGVSDRTQDKPDALANIIEQGAKNPWNHRRYRWMSPRPFVTNTQEEINNNPEPIIEMIQKRIEHNK